MKTAGRKRLTIRRKPKAPAAINTVTLSELTNVAEKPKAAHNAAMRKTAKTKVEMTVRREATTTRFPLFFASKETRKRLVKYVQNLQHFPQDVLIEAILAAKPIFAYASCSSTRMKKIRRKLNLERMQAMRDQLHALPKDLLPFILWDAKEQRIFRNKRKKGREVLGIDLENYLLQPMQGEFAYNDDAVVKQQRKLAREEKIELARRNPHKAANATAADYVRNLKSMADYLCHKTEYKG